MEKTFDTEDFGEVKVRTVMIDLDGSNLEEGIEITGEFFGDEPIELLGWRDVDGMTDEEVNEMVHQYG